MKIIYDAYKILKARYKLTDFQSKGCAGVRVIFRGNEVRMLMDGGSDSPQCHVRLPRARVGPACCSKTCLHGSVWPEG